MRRSISQRIVNIALPILLVYIVGYEVAKLFGWL
jgi:hypothetical protein